MFYYFFNKYNNYKMKLPSYFWNNIISPEQHIFFNFLLNVLLYLFILSLLGESKINICKVNILSLCVDMRTS